MNVESLIFRKLTPNEFKAITNTINSPGGGSQTYIDFPKGSISDEEFKDFFEKEGTPNANGFEWVFKVNSLSLGRTQQEEIISVRRDSSNSLREQNNNNRIEIWKNERSGFPSNHYDDKNNPIIVFILKSDDKEFWAGWFYRNNCDDTWPMTKGLSYMLWKDCAFIKFDNPIPFDVNDFTWPFLKSNSINKTKQNKKEKSLQQIYYGAPGTGKSHTINEQTEGESVIRTTFHPDSDYSTFVGAYKPTMGLLPICDELGQPMKIGSTVLHKEQIIYEFVDQAFLQAYVQAWKFYAENSENPKKQYLVIEEINRGNCAQIFGDLFQLLDRNDYGFSDYPINADKDMTKQLTKAFKKEGISITDLDADKINAMYKGRNVVDKLMNGEILLLPNNLYIWATMNTSDQSLFPIDSAFKRRWDWQYMPIGKDYDKNGNEYKWFIEIAGKKYSWWSFLEKINAQIAEATQSEDKKLGFFFCKAEEDKISVEKFVGKVIFYLWNDVFKDYGFEREIFKDTDGTELSFAKFYKSDAKGNAIVQNDKVEVFLNNLKVDLLDSTDDTVDNNEDEDGNTPNSDPAGRDYTKYSINGIGAYGKNRLASECVKKYIELHPLKNAEEVFNDWLSLGINVPHFIESKEQYDARTDNSKDRSIDIQCGDTVLWVAKDGYGSNGKVLVLKDAVNSKNWGITIEEA